VRVVPDDGFRRRLTKGIADINEFGYLTDIKLLGWARECSRPAPIQTGGLSQLTLPAAIKSPKNEDNEMHPNAKK